MHCRKIHNLFVRALETGRKVHERKLSSFMKKMKDSCKLDINQSVPENILSVQKLRENNVEGIDIMQISGHNNVAFINNYSTLSEERHKKVSNILSNTESETNRNAFQQTYLVKPPQILQPVALLMFRVEAIPMFLFTVPIQICQVKLVLCFTAWSSITNGECVHNFHK